MKISLLTVFPDLFEKFFDTSIIGRARQQGLITCNVMSFFSLVAPKERIDAPTFGHGSGLLIKPEVIEKGIEHAQNASGKAFKVFFSPQGKKLTQPLLRDIAKKVQETQHLLLVCSRYEGMDERVEQEYADEVLSLGDYVLMGGDLPAMVFLEGLLRLVPGIVGKQESVEHESFSGPFVDYPEYTQPVTWHGKTVPEVLRSGNHAAMQAWRHDQATSKTVLQHYDWLRTSPLSIEDKKRAARFIPPHYCALMHTDVLLPDSRVGTTSVTSLDIHDIARSARTYGLKKYFIVTPLHDQQKLVTTLLDFWQKGTGITYNPQRHNALSSVELAAQLDEVIGTITQIHGVPPLIIATSARTEEHERIITYADQGKVWQHNRPVLFVFGTGKGLSPELLARCDYLLGPLCGLSDFNHLSVRSAAAIIFDRWLGLNPLRAPE